MDERTLETNDLAAVDAELARKLPGAMAGSGYVLQVDHSVTSNVDYDTYRHFVDKGLAMGTYCPADTGRGEDAMGMTVA